MLNLENNFAIHKSIFPEKKKNIYVVFLLEETSHWAHQYIMNFGL